MNIGLYFTLYALPSTVRKKGTEKSSGGSVM